jgi:hypothetical protein
MPPLTHQLAETAVIWAKELTPVTDRSSSGIRSIMATIPGNFERALKRS